MMQYKLAQSHEIQYRLFYINAKFLGLCGVDMLFVFLNALQVMVAFFEGGSLSHLKSEIIAETS